VFLLFGWWVLAILHPNHVFYAGAVSLVVIISLFLHWRWLAYSPKAITRLVIESGDQWELLLNNHDVIKAELHPASFISPYLCVLAFNGMNGKRYASVLISGFSMPKELTRKLILRIRV